MIIFIKQWIVFWKYLEQLVFLDATEGNIISGIKSVDFRGLFTMLNMLFNMFLVCYGWSSQLGHLKGIIWISNWPSALLIDGSFSDLNTCLCSRNFTISSAIFATHIVRSFILLLLQFTPEYGTLDSFGYFSWTNYALKETAIVVMKLCSKNTM